MARVAKKTSTPKRVTVQISKEAHDRMKLLADLCNQPIGLAIDTVLRTVQARPIKVAKPRTKEEMAAWLMGGKECPHEVSYTLSQMFCSDSGTGLIQNGGK